jgi:archaeal flagellar protein FlaI
MAQNSLDDLFNEIKEKKKKRLADLEKPADMSVEEHTEKQKIVNKIVEQSEEKGVAEENTPSGIPAPTQPEETPETPDPVEETTQETPSETAEETDTPSIEEQIARESHKKILAEYKHVKIYTIKNNPLPVYVVPIAKPTAAEKNIILLIKEAATRLISISPYKIRDIEQRRTVYKQRIMEILDANPELHIPKQRFSYYAESVVREMVGYGPIDSLVRDDLLEEIMVIGPKKPVYVFHRDHGMLSTNVEFYSGREIQDLINKIGREVGRRLDIASPLLDARLPDGSRVNATIPPASVDGATLTIRKFREDPYSIIDLVQKGTITAEVAAHLWVYADGLGTRPANILITGGTGSGKTTLLNVLMSFVPAHERIVSIEDTAELNLPLDHWIRLEARPPGLEGSGELTLDILTKNALRMRPDRIVVGEVRHDEAFTLFTAMNTGHAGSSGTVHANSPDEAVARLTSPPMNVPEIMLSGLDLVLVIHRIHDKRKGTIRRVTEIAEVIGVLDKKTRTNTLFERDPVEDTMVRTNIPSAYEKTLQSFSGLTKKALDSILSKREKFINQLVKSNTRDSRKVSEKTRAFFADERD